MVETRKSQPFGICCAVDSTAALPSSSGRPSTSTVRVLSDSQTHVLTAPFPRLGFIYHGFNLNVDILGGSVYQNFLLAGLIEIPSTALNLIGLRYTGRKSFTIATILIAALCYSAIVLLQLWWPVDHWAVVTLSMLGKLFIFSTYNAIYIHAGTH